MFTPDDNGVYVVTLTATDKDGGVSPAASATLTVDNVPPTAGLSGPSTGVRGQAQPFTLTAGDPSPGDQAAGSMRTRPPTPCGRHSLDSEARPGAVEEATSTSEGEAVQPGQMGICRTPPTVEFYSSLNPQDLGASVRPTRGR
jgi:hypothetical protein